MAFLKVFVLAFVYLVQLVSCDDSSVKEFKDWKSFKEDLSSTPYLLVDYYATWCPHCVKFAPIYEEASKTIESGNIKDKASLTKVECDGDGKKICRTNGIQGYPTIKLYHEGKVFDEYYGERNADDIVEYMKKVVKTGEAQFLGKKINTHQKVCMAKSYRTYVHHK